jgi:integrase
MQAFHDLRHTGCTRMLEAGVPFSVLATSMGWSTSTTVRMARRYGHIGQTAQRQAVNALKGRILRVKGHRIGHSLRRHECGNSLTD